MKAEKKARAIIRKMKAKKDDKNVTDFSGRSKQDKYISTITDNSNI